MTAGTVTETLEGVREVARAVVPDRLHQAARFGTVGAMAFVVDVGSFNLLRLLDVGPLTSKTLAVVLATTFAYAGNRGWTFRERQVRSQLGSYVVFALLNGAALLIALACLGVTYYVLGLQSALAENVAANGVGLVLGMLFRWWGYRRWVFHLPPSADHDEDVSASREGTPDDVLRDTQGQNAGHAPGPRLVRSRT